MTKEDKEILKNCWIMTTTHELDDENKKLKSVIEKVLNENMTSEEKSRWGYEYYIENHLYNEDLDHNIKFLADWAEILKGMGNRNYPYIYAINRILDELKKEKENRKLYIISGLGGSVAVDEYIAQNYVSKKEIKKIRDRAECVDPNVKCVVIKDLSRLIENYEEEN